MREVPSKPGRLLGVVLDLCRLRSGPQELPHSLGLLAALLVAGLALDLATGDALELNQPVLARSLLSTILLLGLSWTALAIRGLGHRYLQTATALVACSIAFSLLILPMAFQFGTLPAADAAPTPAQMLIVWLGLGTLVWKISVDAHIVRQAIEAPYWLGFLLALSWMIADFALARVIFSPAS
jgi:hypothetical protein